MYFPITIFLIYSTHMVRIPIKARMAPSPTGFLHVGTAQSAIFNYLFAKKSDGEFHVRIEDTDEERSSKEFESDILEGFKWLGLDWDGPITRSSDNKKEYRKYLEQLLSSGKAFWCNHSKEELEREQKEQMAKKEPPRHVCAHKHEGLPSGQVLRLRVNDQSDREIIFDDVIRGRVSFRESLLGDISIARNLDSPLFHFAVVIDDIAMEISHILRGEDHISNTPKHILIYEALEKDIPQYAHLPLLLAPDRSKLSKRTGIVSLNEYKKDYLPEVIFNFLATLSHTYSQEILSKEELIKEFDLKKIHKSGAVFDIKKLNWLNSQYIKRLSPSEFKKVVANEKISDMAVPIITERLEKLSDVKEFDFLWEEAEYPKELLLWKTSSFNDVKMSLMEVLGSFKAKTALNASELRESLDALGKEKGDRGLVYWPLRVALSGREKSPDPIQIAEVLGREEVMERIKTALEKIE